MAMPTGVEKALNGSPSPEVEVLRSQVQRLAEENSRLTEENETLKNRCQKLARSAMQVPPTQAPQVHVGTQTEPEANAGASTTSSGQRPTLREDGGGSGCGGRLPPVVERMLCSPVDETVQLQGIETLFAQQTQVADGAQDNIPAAVVQASLEVAIAIFGNHPDNRVLLLKASQFLSVFLAEPHAQQQLPVSELFQAARQVVRAGARLLGEASAAADAPGKMKPKDVAVQNTAKLLTWFLQLLTVLLPPLGPHLRDGGGGAETQVDAFVRALLAEVVSPLLQSSELPQEALLLKCVRLLPLLPMEPRIQKACLDSGAVHSLVLAFHRCAGGRLTSGAGGGSGDAGGGGGGGGEGAEAEPPKAAVEAELPKSIRFALRCVFAQNLELCVRAMDDTFVGDEFVCLEVLGELREMEKKQRGTFRALDEQWGIIGKALGLWTFHQRRVFEDPDPSRSASLVVLQKVAELLSAVLVKLPAQVLLKRMQEFQAAEPLQRVGLQAIHTNSQLRLQVAVSYVDNWVIPVVIGCLQMLLRRYEGTLGADGRSPCEPPSRDVEAAFQLLRDERLPPDGWTYVQHCLEICIQIVSHWSAANLSIKEKAGALDAHSAPNLLAQGGLVDVLAEIVDPVKAGFELQERPPQAVLRKACEALQTLFEQSGHICLFCMGYYTDVKLMVSLGAESLAADPLAAFPDMQQQAVEQLATSFEKFAPEDEKLGKKILKALTNLFETSYHLVVWFLQGHSLNTLGDYQSLNIHIEAVRAVSRAPYWNIEDAILIPDFVALVAQLLLGSVEGLADSPATVVPAQPMKRRVLDDTEAEEVVQASLSALLHLLLIDPSPPTALQCLVKSLGAGPQGSDVDSSLLSEEPAGSEKAVNNTMRVMQVFPHSDRVQMSCQHLLTSLLGE